MSWLLILAIAFVVSISANCLLRLWAERWGLIAVPGEHRGHSAATPLTGGLAIVATLLIVLLPSAGQWQSDFIGYFLIATLLLATVGLLDDRYTVPFLWRFVAQILACGIMVYQGNSLNHLGELFSTNTLYLGSYTTLMTIFATVGVINAINMIDGLDGLAGTLVIAVLVLLAAHTFTVDYLRLIVALVGAIAGFLVFNLRYRWAGKQHHARIFMGDTGSTVLGFALAWLFIYGSQQSERLFDPIFAVWVLALPLFDTVSVMLIRPLYGRSPFSADKIHVHHHLQDRLESVNLTVLVMLLLFLAYVMIGLLCRWVGIEQYIQTWLFSVCFISHLTTQWYFSRQKIVNETIV